MINKNKICLCFEICINALIQFELKELKELKFSKKSLIIKSHFPTDTSCTSRFCIFLKYNMFELDFGQREKSHKIKMHLPNK